MPNEHSLHSAAVPPTGEPPLPASRLSFPDKLIKTVGHTAAWLNVVLILVIITQVILRYVFHRGFVALEELQWHLYAIMIMFGLSYGIVSNSHIRLDLFHRNFSPRKKEIVELLGLLLLLMPLVVILFLHSLDFVATSYRIGERSDSPLGLPYRWIIKSIIPISMSLLAVAALSRIVRASLFLIRKS
jgi:TRAP-type mannitol/chloroaromatic compound transport system permease small subunit